MEGFTMYTIKYISLAIVLTVALSLFIFGQDTYNVKSKAEMKHFDLSEIMGEPTVNVIVDELHMKIWLITQEQHEEIMRGEINKKMMDKKREGATESMKMIGVLRTSSVVERMEDTSTVKGKDMKGVKTGSKKVERSTKESILTGTHHIMLDVIDAESGNEIVDASAKIDIVSPSDKNTSVDLTMMRMSHFGGGLTLDEEGKYDFSLSVNVNGVSTTTQFQHTVK
jgi:hypothetical protein